MIVQLIGYIATIGTILSFAVKDQKRLRLLNAIACLGWIVYGIGLSEGPIIIVNTTIFILNLIWLYKNREYTIGNDTKDKLKTLAGIKEHNKEKGKAELSKILDSKVKNELVHNHSYIEPDKKVETMDADFMYKWIKNKSGK